MNRRLRIPGFALLLLAAASVVPVGAAAQDAPPEPVPAPAPAPMPVAEEIPKAAPRAPLPPEPKDAGKKAIQEILRRWFGNEPKIPLKGKTDIEVKSDRAKASGDLESEVQKWPNCLRLVAWWKARLEETQPSENKPAGVIKPKEEFVFGEGDRRKTFVFAVSVPASYRGKGTDTLPVIITVIDKDADPKKLFKDVYGKLLDTHLVVASYENSLYEKDKPTPSVMVNAIYYACLNYRCDRDRFALDGIGKGARFAEELATAEYSTLQWNGVVLRGPMNVQPLEGNLGLFPVGVVDPGSSVPQALTATVKAHVEAGGPGTLIPGGDPVKVQDFIAALPPRKANDQTKPYTVFFKSTGKMPKWGFWFLVNQAVDDSQPVRVKISRDPALNVVDLDATNLAEGTLLLNDEVLDLDQPVHVRVNGIVVAKEKLARSIKHTFDWSGGYATFLLGPRNYFVVAALPFVVDGDARIPLKDRQAAANADKKSEEDRKKTEEADRLAAEAAKKAEEDAKNPKPAPASEDGKPAPANPAPDGAAPPMEQMYYNTLEEAKAAKRGRPILVIFKGPVTDPIQLSLAAVLASEDVKKAMAAMDLVTLSPAEAGDAGKPTRDLLAELSGKADAAAPYLVLFGAKSTLSLAGMTKDEEILAAVLKFLSGTAPAEPVKGPPPPVVKSVDWGVDFDAAKKLSKEKGTPIAVLFTGADDAKGQAELLKALKEDGACTQALSKLICVRLDTKGEGGAKALELQKFLGGARTPPVVLYIVRMGANEKGEETTGTPDAVDPANLLAEPATFLPKLQAALAVASAEKAPATPAASTDAPKPEPAKPEPAKPEAPKPEAPKPDAPKPADPK